MLVAATLVAAGLAAPAAAATRWSPAVTLSAAGPGQDAFNPQVAVDGRGNAVAVWELWDSTSSDSIGVQAARRPAGGSWGPPVTLSGPDATEAQVGGERSGRRGGGVASVGRERVSGAGGPAARRLVLGEGRSRCPHRARTRMNRKWRWTRRGNAVAVWQLEVVATYRVQAARRPAGGSWGTPVWLSGPHARSARVAVNGRGAAVAVWQLDGRRDSGSTVQAVRRPAGSSWGRPVALSDPHAGAFAGAPDVALDGRGAAVAVWQRTDGSTDRVEAARRPAGGSWGRPVRLSDPGQDAENAQVAVNWRGTAVVVWELWESPWVTPSGVQAARRPSGGAWGKPVEVVEPGQDAGTCAGCGRRAGQRDRRVERVRGRVGGADGSPAGRRCLAQAGHVVRPGNRTRVVHRQVAVDGQGNVDRRVGTRRTGRRIALRRPAGLPAVPEAGRITGAGSRRLDRIDRVVRWSTPSPGRRHRALARPAPPSAPHRTASAVSLTGRDLASMPID